MKELDFIPNQKYVIVHREMVKDSKKQDRQYLIIYQDNCLQAMQNLSHTAFKIYLWLCSFKPYTKIAYSPEFLRKHLNICKDTARKGFRELEEKGYLYCGENKYKYSFYENPTIAQQENIDDYQEQIQQLQDMILDIQNKMNNKE